MKNGGTCDWPECDQDAVEEDMKTGAERCALHAGCKEARMADNRPFGHGFSYGGQQLPKIAFDELNGIPRNLGIDFGTGDKWAILEWTRDAEGNIQVRHVTEAEFLGVDVGNQYTGGQDF